MSYRFMDLNEACKVPVLSNFYSTIEGFLFYDSPYWYFY